MLSFSIWYVPLLSCCAWYRNWEDLPMCWIESYWNGCFVTPCHWWYWVWQVSWIRWLIRLFFLSFIPMRLRLPYNSVSTELPVRLPWLWLCLPRHSALLMNLLYLVRARRKIAVKCMLRLWSSLSSLLYSPSWQWCFIWTFCAISSGVIIGTDYG